MHEPGVSVNSNAAYSIEASKATRLIAHVVTVTSEPTRMQLTSRPLAESRVISEAATMWLSGVALGNPDCQSQICLPLETRAWSQDRLRRLPEQWNRTEVSRLEDGTGDSGRLYTCCPSLAQSRGREQVSLTWCPNLAQGRGRDSRCLSPIAPLGPATRVIHSSWGCKRRAPRGSL